MSNDHFVSQTYLKHFGDAIAGGMLHAYRKKDGKEFPCWPCDVCSEWDGDSNPLLQYQKLLGEFRKIFEPHWNASVANVVQEKTAYNDKYVISGFMANLMACTPTWRRVGGVMTQQMTTARLSFAKRMKVKHGEQPELDVEAIEMLERGEIVMEPNLDYIKGLATKHLIPYSLAIYDLDWIIWQNTSTEPFITSDYPLSLSYTGSPRDPMYRILPITPQVAIEIRFDPLREPMRTELSSEELEARLALPSAGKIIYAQCDADRVSRFNVIQARSAENLVFSSERSDSTRKLVQDASKYQMGIRYVELPDPAGDPNAILMGTVLGVWEH